MRRRQCQHPRIQSLPRAGILEDGCKGSWTGRFRLGIAKDGFDLSDRLSMTHPVTAPMTVAVEEKFAIGDAACWIYAIEVWPTTVRVLAACVGSVPPGALLKAVVSKSLTRGLELGQVAVEGERQAGGLFKVEWVLDRSRSGADAMEVVFPVSRWRISETSVTALT